MRHAFSLIKELPEKYELVITDAGDSLGHDGHQFNLDQPFRDHKCSDTNQAARGRFFHIEVLSRHLANVRNVLGFQIDDEIGDLHDVVEGCSRDRKRDFEVLKDVFHLGTHVTLPHDFGPFVHAHLPGDVDRLSAGHRDDVGEPVRRVQRGRVEKLLLHGRVRAEMEKADPGQL